MSLTVRRVVTGHDKNGRAIVTIDETDGSPDGLVLDDEGGLWLALWGGGQVRRYTPDGVEVEITDDGARVKERRLLGMHERVRVYGGQLEAGPRRGGGHGVLARLPREAAA